jgi:hypothetical protein
MLNLTSAAGESTLGNSTVIVGLIFNENIVSELRINFYNVTYGDQSKIKFNTEVLLMLCFSLWNIQSADSFCIINFK